jgi:dihydroorotase
LHGHGFKENTELIKGIKAHPEPGGVACWGLEDVRLAARIGKEADLPLYIHFGQLWQLPETGAKGVDADDILPQVVELLKPGDILATPFTRHPGGFVHKNGHVHPIVSEALACGLWVDVGHGSHFSFKMARIALDAGIVPHTLGADMHGYNTQVLKPAGTPDAHPDEEHMFFGQVRFSLVSAMTPMMACGLTLKQVVPMVTSNPARILRLEDQIGTLKPSAVGGYCVPMKTTKSALHAYCVQPSACEPDAISMPMHRFCRSPRWHSRGSEEI